MRYFLPSSLTGRLHQRHAVRFQFYAERIDDGLKRREIAAQQRQIGDAALIERAAHARECSVTYRPTVRELSCVGYRRALRFT